MTAITIISLFIIFQLKHFIADYPLQSEYMLGKFKENGWIAPLAAHCGIHALFTMMIVGVFLDSFKFALMASAFDFSVHFLMDRIKASPKILGRYKMEDKKFWWALGLDQMVHHITHYAIICFMLLKVGFIQESISINFGNVSYLALLFSGVTAFFSIHAYCKVVGMEHSTHQVQYMPVQEYGSFQEAIQENKDEYKDVMGMPITDPEEKEKVRHRKLMEGFEEAYSEPEI